MTIFVSYFCRIEIGLILTPPPNSCILPPPDPPEGGKGGGRDVYTLSGFIQLTQPHMLRISTVQAKLG
jgi:hypothetical protein